jgi:hypothetical protein
MVSHCIQPNSCSLCEYFEANINEADRSILLYPSALLTFGNKFSYRRLGKITVVVQHKEC